MFTIFTINLTQSTVDAITFPLSSANFDLMTAPDEKSGDHKNHLNSSWEYLYQIS